MGKCIRCGRTKRGVPDDWVCDPCEEFADVVEDVWAQIESEFESNDAIDPDAQREFQLLADSGFLNTQNPQTALFYKFSDLLIETALDNATQITEEELNNAIRTTRTWSDTFDLFSELNLITVELDESSLQRVISIKEKVRKAARSINVDERNEQLQERIAGILANYVMLHILRKVANMETREQVHDLPYDFRPRTMWVTLMFLWKKAYDREDSFTDEELEDFLSSRRINSSSRSKIMRELANASSRETQGLIRNVSLDGNNRVFTFSRYVIREMDRLRDARKRDERGGR